MGTELQLWDKRGQMTDGYAQFFSVFLFLSSVFYIGEPAGIRTQDTRLKRAVLYQLSYRPAYPREEAYNIKEPGDLSTEFQGNSLKNYSR